MMSFEEDERDEKECTLQYVHIKFVCLECVLVFASYSLFIFTFFYTIEKKKKSILILIFAPLIQLLFIPFLLIFLFNYFVLYTIVQKFLLSITRKQEDSIFS